jgi:hypothetical protein
MGFEAGRANGGLALLDVFGTRRDEQYVHELGIFFVRTDDFIIEAHLFHREGNVLVRLDFDLSFEIPLRETRRHLDNLGNRRIAADCDGDVRGLCTRTLGGATNRVADRLGVNDGLFTHRAGGRWLCRIRLDPIALAALRELYQLNRRRRDIEAQQWLLFLAEKHVNFLLSR